MLQCVKGKYTPISVLASRFGLSLNVPPQILSIKKTASRRAFGVKPTIALRRSTCIILRNFLSHSLNSIEEISVTNLLIRNLTLSTTNPVQGGPVTVSFDLVNNGSATSTAFFTDLYASVDPYYNVNEGQVINWTWA